MDAGKTILETRERIVRLETKMDSVLTHLERIAERQEACPAREAYLANKIKVQRENRFLAWGGWIIAVVSTIATIVNLWLSKLSST